MKAWCGPPRHLLQSWATAVWDLVHRGRKGHVTSSGATATWWCATANHSCKTCAPPWARLAPPPRVAHPRRGARGDGHDRRPNPATRGGDVLWTDAEGLEDGKGDLRPATRILAGRSGAELVRVRAERDVHHRVGATAHDAGPRPPDAAAVPGEAEDLRSRAGIEKDGDDLPVALVRPPDGAFRAVL